MQLRDIRELATVLAALRHWQETLIQAENAASRTAHGVPEVPAAWDVATNNDSLEPLGVDEIDALCKRLNYGEVPA